MRTRSTEGISRRHRRQGVPRPIVGLVVAISVAVGLVGCAVRPTPYGEATPFTGASAPGTPGAVTADEPYVLVGAGDIASCSSQGDEATAALIDGIEGTVFTAGDNVYDDGTAAEFADCYDPSWGRFRDRTLPVPGNHDYNTAGAAGYFSYFGAAAGDPSQGWYATEVGTWRVYALNSNCAAIGGCEAGSPQERWLRADLAANPSRCAMAIWHHPLFSSGRHGGSSATFALWQALQDGGADVVVTGHDHTYERFGPQTATGVADPANGIVAYVVGTGGRSHYEFKTVAPNSLVRNTDTYGVIRFELYADRWSFEFVPEAGRSFTDTGTAKCH